VSQPRLTISATVLGTTDPPGLAEFYSRLLGWDITWNEPDWAMIKPPGGGTGLSFQLEPTHIPPVWPQRPGEQQMMMHLDVATPDLPASVAHAEQLGARQADFQPQDNVRVMLDPAGHPFCLFIEGT
jgi:catechol 2,3-dioxygenase-like lactoylglutathione lyase family enzyme